MITATARRREGYAHDVEVDGHAFVIDEPTSLGGTDRGPSPMRAVAGALAACTAITVEMYANRKGWDLGAVEARVDFEPDERGTVERFEVVLRVSPALDDEQIGRIRTIAGKCPVHRALSAGGGIEVADRVERLG
jgi:putative redox protein